jgi:predicted XRE-type DNA-binding protein
MQILEQKRQIQQCMSECGVDGACGIKRPKVNNKFDLKVQNDEQDRLLAQLSSSSSSKSELYSLSSRSD